ncbi:MULTISPECIES: DUF2865 domain-containing protein [unclassified Mesorhizobium]|uniref:DUF2865 domain-containing protein n=1 Tax=unclassified Mesorhizobium TaxID=325217 RepID=UPI00112A491B|nr:MULTISPECIES: DUF2865 domain-containing protein [unclassified Mesorhizobium]MBZ9742342.1 DUF2865 domain-containing protein [Mesorhizobium sp. CO1-1-4]MBZ9802428.1 DUF2865 domain-containing protein [Mesorhizobium sp. ES1-6]TPL87141.1 DUF2865 domain-containing protein [Mesorhizobium sp. B2-3-12]
MTRFYVFMMIALAMVAASAFGTTSSYADSCGAIKSQLLSAGRGGGVSPAQAQLRRQLAAIQGLERQRKCTAQSAAGGFFNACADLARNRTEVQRQIAAASNSGRDNSGLQARFAALGCSSQARQERPASKTQSAAGAISGGNAMLFCVRLSDGYFFPAPKSQFAGSGDLKEMADQCRYICDDPAVDLYTLSDISQETDSMVSLDTRKPYTELPTAFRYRDDADFKACEVKRYYQRVAELRARTVTPTNMTNAIIPLPQPKPDLGDVAAIPKSDTEVSGAAQLQAIEADKRTVRVVGPAFFPAE